LKGLDKNGTFALNTQANYDWNTVSSNSIKKTIAFANAKVYTIDASNIAADLDSPGIINMIMQTVNFHSRNVLLY
jgi:pyruvate-ferredoxin/flavodoxin oxidoreductase